MTHGQIVILNGAPRSGKTSIAKAIQDTFEGVWINLGVDTYMRMIPARYQPGIGLRPGGEAPDLEPVIATLYGALYASIAAHSRLGVPVVADVGHHEGYTRPLALLARCAGILEGLPTLFVGVRCPLQTILSRREQTGYPARLPDGGVLPAVLRWQNAVHAHGRYDMTLDTGAMTPQACADAIALRLALGPPGTAFAAFCTRGDAPIEPEESDV